MWSNASFSYNSNNPDSCEDIGAVKNVASNCICTSDVYEYKSYAGLDEYHKLLKDSDEVKYPGNHNNVYQDQEQTNGFNKCNSFKANYSSNLPPAHYVEYSSGVYKQCSDHPGNNDQYATYENNVNGTGTGCTKRCNKNVACLWPRCSTSPAC